MLKINLFKQNDDNIYSVVDGVSFPIEEVSDVTFSTKILGEGVAIAPTSSIIYAPCSGKLVTLFPTGHAFGIKRKDGLEVLVHVGVDTVTLKGKGFTIFKKQNEFVKKGEKILEVDFHYLSQMNLDSTIMVILTNLQNKKINFINYGEVKGRTSQIIKIS